LQRLGIGQSDQMQRFSGADAVIELVAELERQHVRLRLDVIEDQYVGKKAFLFSPAPFPAVPVPEPA